MKLNLKGKMFTLLVAACAVAFSACTAAHDADAPDPKFAVEALSGVMSAQEVENLSEYTNLKSVDLSGSTCYREIVEFAENNPAVEVKYTVNVGGTEIDAGASGITLANDGFDYDVLFENLEFLPAISSVTFDDTSMEKKK